MATMQQLTIVSAGKLEWRDMPEPRIEGSGEAIVEPVVVATCDIDPGFIAGVFPVQEPFAFGHEGMARVVDVGDTVESVKPGDLVAVPFQISCGTCPQCRRGATASCSGVEPRRAMYGMAPLARREWGGFLSDRVRVPYADAMLVPVPSAVDPIAAASISDNLPDAWRSVAPHLSRMPDASVLVVGGALASVGLYATAIATALGAPVTYVDDDPRRTEIARSLGAEVVAEAYPARVGSHLITVDASFNADGLYCALRSTDGDGICTCIASFLPDVPMPLDKMYIRNITFVIGRVSARSVMEPLLELIEKDVLKPEVVTTRVVTWDEAPDALVEPFTKLVMIRE